MNDMLGIVELTDPQQLMDLHGMNSYRHSCDMGVIEGRGCIRLEYTSVHLLHGDYAVSVGVWPDEYTSFMTDVAYDAHEKAYLFRVESERNHGAGIVMQPATWRLLPPGEQETLDLERALAEAGSLPAKREGQEDAGPGEAEAVEAKVSEAEGGS